MKYQIFLFAIILFFSLGTLSASAQQYPELGIEIQTVAENLKAAHIGHGETSSL